MELLKKVIGDFEITISHGATIITRYNGHNEVLAMPPFVFGYPVSAIVIDAFAKCVNLRGIELPDSLSRIDDDSFSHCRNLKYIKVSSNNNCYCDVDGVLFNKDKTKLIAYPGAKEDLEYCIPDSVRRIASSAFFNCRALTYIKIPEGVTEIKENTFYLHNDFAKIEIPESVTTISDFAFDETSDVTIICKKGSYAETFAKGLNFNVEYID